MKLEHRVRRSRKIRRLELAARRTGDPRKAKRLARLKRDERCEFWRQVAAAGQKMGAALREFGEAATATMAQLSKSRIEMKAYGAVAR